MNYIITAASRERTGIQVAIVSVARGWVGGARPRSLLPAPPSSPQTSRGRGSYFECLLPAHGWGGRAGARRGKRKEGKGQKGFVLHGEEAL